MKIVHFLGSMKPWHYGFDATTRSVILPLNRQSLQQAEHVQQWWDIFIAKVQPRLTTECTGICAHLANLTISPPAPGDGATAAAAGGGDAVGEEAVDPMSKRRQWEAGQIDYLGGDAFESIQKKLDEKMNGSN